MLRGVEVMLKVPKCCPRTGSTNKIPLGNRCDSQEVIKTHNQNWVKKVTGEKNKEISCLVGRRDRPSEADLWRRAHAARRQGSRRRTAKDGEI